MHPAKRRITAALILAMTLATLASCGSDTGNSNDGTTAQTTGGEDTTSVAEETEPSEFKAADADFGGADFIIAENDIGDWMQSAFIETENGDVLNDSIYRRNSIVEDLYNVNIKGFKIEGERNRQDLAQLKNGILAGDKDYDVAFIPGSLCATMFSDPSYLVPLSDVSTLDLTHSWWAQDSVDTMTFGSKTISATGDMVVTTTGSSTVTLFNKALANQYDLDVYSVVRDGKFTVDYVYDTAKLVSADLNGDTKMDANDDQFGWMVESLNIIHLIGASGEKLVTRDESGLPVSNIDSSKLVEVVMKYVDIINDKDSVISVQDNRIKDGGPAGVFDGGRMLFWETNLQRMKAARSFTVDFGLIPFPKYEESDEYIAPVGGYWDSWLMIPATNSDTDRTGTVLEALGYYSQQLVTPAFVETSVTTKALRDDDSAEMLDMVLKNRSFDTGVYFSWGTNEAFKASVNHVSNFTSVAASGKSKIDASIASFIEALGE